MKIIYFLPAFLLFQFFATPIVACSFSPKSFCSGSADLENNIIIAGEIIGVDNDGIDVRVFQWFKGNATSDTIRVWDGTDFDCNGFFSMAAGDLGGVGDSVLLNLPVIDSIENTWDVIGEYRRPGYIQYTRSLRLEGDTLFGFINGLPLGSSQNLYKVSYDTFLDAWNNDDCPKLILSSSEVSLKKEDIRVINPFHQTLNIQIDSKIQSNNKLDLFSMTGQLIKSKTSKEHSISWKVPGLRSGIYLLRITSEDKVVLSFKVMKQ